MTTLNFSIVKSYKPIHDYIYILSAKRLDSRLRGNDRGERRDYQEERD